MFFTSLHGECLGIRKNSDFALHHLSHDVNFCANQSIDLYRYKQQTAYVLIMGETVTSKCARFLLNDSHWDPISCDTGWVRFLAPVVFRATGNDIAGIVTWYHIHCKTSSNSIPTWIIFIVLSTDSLLFAKKAKDECDDEEKILRVLRFINSDYPSEKVAASGH